MKTKKILLAILITLSLNIFGQVEYTLTSISTNSKDLQYIIDNHPSANPFNKIKVNFRKTAKYNSKTVISYSFYNISDNGVISKHSWGDRIKYRRYKLVVDENNTYGQNSKIEKAVIGYYKPTNIVNNEDIEVIMIFTQNQGLLIEIKNIKENEKTTVIYK